MSYSVDMTVWKCKSKNFHGGHHMVTQARKVYTLYCHFLHVHSGIMHFAFTSDSALCCAAMLVSLSAHPSKVRNWCLLCRGRNQLKPCPFPNRPFHSCLLSDLASEWQWDWRWPCFDTDLLLLLCKSSCSALC